MLTETLREQDASLRYASRTRTKIERRYNHRLTLCSVGRRSQHIGNLTSTSPRACPSLKRGRRIYLLQPTEILISRFNNAKLSWHLNLKSRGEQQKYAVLSTLT